MYPVIFAVHNEGRTLDAMKIREHVEASDPMEHV
jgi:hypothetical protein